MANKDLSDKLADRVERHLGMVQHTADMERARRRDQARFRALEEDGKAPFRDRHGALGGGGAVGPVQPTTEDGDAGGKIVGSARRCRDTLDELLRRGTITGAEQEAGRRFQADFRRAGLDKLRAAALVRSPGGTAEGPEGAADAKRAVERALAALGGRGSPLAVVVWEVLGCGRSMSEVLSARQLRPGWTMNKHAAKTLLILGLVGLSMAYGLARGQRGA